MESVQLSCVIVKEEPEEYDHQPSNCMNSSVTAAQLTPSDFAELRTYLHNHIMFIPAIGQMDIPDPSTSFFIDATMELFDSSSLSAELKLKLMQSCINGENCHDNLAGFSEPVEVEDPDMLLRGQLDENKQSLVSKEVQGAHIMGPNSGHGNNATSKESCDKKGFPCDICGDYFKEERSVFRHKRTIHTLDRAFKCDKCISSFTLLHMLEKHKLKHTEELKNSQVSQNSPTKSIVKVKPVLRDRHLNSQLVRRRGIIHRNEKPFRCRRCRSRFRSRTFLFLHQQQCQRTKPSFYCSSLLHRAKSPSDETSLRCGRWSLHFSDSSTLTKHQKKHIKLERDVKSLERWLRCSQCSYRCPDQSCLTAHYRRNHPEKVKFRCRRCGTAFANSADLGEHLVTHQIEDLYLLHHMKPRHSVLYSEMSAKSASYLPVSEKFNPNSRAHPPILNAHKLEPLVIHARTKLPNSAEREYLRMTCHGKLKNRVLPRHIAHVVTKPHSSVASDEINKIYDHHLTSINSCFKNRVSDMKRSYACQMCEASFMEPDQLLRHVKHHSGVKPYICKAYGVRFAKKNSLQRRAVIQSRKLRYKCLWCPSTYSSSWVLSSHIRTTHASALPAVDNSVVVPLSTISTDDTEAKELVHHDLTEYFEKTPAGGLLGHVPVDCSQTVLTSVINNTNTDGHAEVLPHTVPRTNQSTSLSLLQVLPTQLPCMIVDLCCSDASAKVKDESACSVIASSDGGGHEPCVELVDDSILQLEKSLMKQKESPCLQIAFPAEEISDVSTKFIGKHIFNTSVTKPLSCCMPNEIDHCYYNHTDTCTKGKVSQTAHIHGSSRERRKELLKRQMLSQNIAEHCSYNSHDYWLSKMNNSRRRAPNHLRKLRRKYAQSPSAALLPHLRKLLSATHTQNSFTYSNSVAVNPPISTHSNCTESDMFFAMDNDTAKSALSCPVSDGNTLIKNSSQTPMTVDFNVKSFKAKQPRSHKLNKYLYSNRPSNSSIVNTSSETCNTESYKILNPFECIQQSSHPVVDGQSASACLVRTNDAVEFLPQNSFGTDHSDSYPVSAFGDPEGTKLDVLKATDSCCSVNNENVKLSTSSFSGIVSAGLKCPDSVVGSCVHVANSTAILDGSWQTVMAKSNLEVIVPTVVADNSFPGQDIKVTEQSYSSYSSLKSAAQKLPDPTLPMHQTCCLGQDYEEENESFCTLAASFDCKLSEPSFMKTDVAFSHLVENQVKQSEPYLTNISHAKSSQPSTVMGDDASLLQIDNGINQHRLQSSMFMNPFQEIHEPAVGMLDQTTESVNYSRKRCSNDGLHGHERYHLEIKPRICISCGSCFVEKSSLQRHAQIHSRKLENNCPQCPSTFSTPWLMFRHIRNIHSSGSIDAEQSTGTCSSTTVHADSIHYSEAEFPCPPESISQNTTSDIPSENNQLLFCSSCLSISSTFNDLKQLWETELYSKQTCSDILNVTMVAKGCKSSVLKSDNSTSFVSNTALLYNPLFSARGSPRQGSLEAVTVVPPAAELDALGHNQMEQIVSSELCSGEQKAIARPTYELSEQSLFDQNILAAIHKLDLPPCSKIRVKKHRHWEYFQKTRSIEMFNSKAKIFQCEQTKQVFTDMISLKRHIKHHGGDHTYSQWKSCSISLFVVEGITSNRTDSGL